jgi:hypothetical protein
VAEGAEGVAVAVVVVGVHGRIAVAAAGTAVEGGTVVVAAAAVGRITGTAAWRSAHDGELLVGLEG